MIKFNYSYLLIFLIIIILIYCYFIINKKEPFDFFTCTMNLENIDPKFKDNFLKFNNRHVSCGPCKNATLKVNVNTCPVNQYGSPLSSCKQSGNITNSFNTPIVFKYDITPDSMNKFFCID